MTAAQRVVVAGAWWLAFAALGLVVSLGWTAGVDAAVRHRVDALAPTAWSLAEVLSLIGSGPVTLAIGVAAIAGLWIAGRHGAARAVFVVMVGAVALDNGLKLAFHRARPEAYFGAAPTSFSFPSAHALFAACLYGVLAIVLGGRSAMWGAAVLGALAIGAARVLLGVHYASDVLAGYLAAIAWLSTVWAAGLLSAPERNRGPSAGRARR